MTDKPMSELRRFAMIVICVVMRAVAVFLALAVVQNIVHNPGGNLSLLGDVFCGSVGSAAAWQFAESAWRKLR